MTAHTPTPDLPWALDKDTIVSGGGIKTHQKYCIRGASNRLVAVMLAKDVAEPIIRAVNTHDDLIAAVKAQHSAIDILFAMLIERTKDDGNKMFFPTKSGQPWEACLLGNAVLKQAEGSS